MTHECDTLLKSIENEQARFTEQLSRLNASSTNNEPAYNRITIGARDSIAGFVSTLNIDGKEYKTFASYEMAALVRHAMLDALHLLRN